jgi:transposase
MKYIMGQDRTQIPLFASSLDQAIDQDNEVRLIDMFVDSLNLADFGFKVNFSENGRPAYLPSLLLKLFIYGYLNRIRSSRALEKECRRNIELMWLLRCLVPDHNTISNFRRDNSKAMGNMVRRARTVLQKDDFTALFDKGYHTGSEFDYVNKLGIEVIVAAPDVASHAPDQAFDVENFTYDKDNDLYVCPANQTLTTNGNWYNKSRGKSVNKIKQYKSPKCRTCPYFTRCTVNKSGRLIERSEHAELIVDNKDRLEKNKDLYSQRQAIIEHTYGILKRQWDFYYIMTKKTIKHAGADVGLMFTALNFRRIINIVGFDTLKVYLRELIALLKSFLCLLAHSKPYGYPNPLLQFFRTSIRQIINFLNFKLIFGLKLKFETGY